MLRPWPRVFSYLLRAISIGPVLRSSYVPFRACIYSCGMSRGYSRDNKHKFKKKKKKSTDGPPDGDSRQWAVDDPRGPVQMINVNQRSININPPLAGRLTSKDSGTAHYPQRLPNDYPVTRRPIMCLLRPNSSHPMKLRSHTRSPTVVSRPTCHRCFQITLHVRTHLVCTYTRLFLLHLLVNIFATTLPSLHYLRPQ